jgi:hypothetical protein
MDPITIFLIAFFATMLVTTIIAGITMHFRNSKIEREYKGNERWV